MIPRIQKQGFFIRNERAKAHSVKPQYRLKTVQAALDLVEFFASSPKHELGISEISAGTGMGKAEVYRLLQNFAEHNYIQENPETRKYRLGVKFMFMGQVVAERIDLLREAEPVLDDLARQTGETVHLLLASPQGPICIAERQTTHQLRFFTRIGMPLPWHAGAASKLLLAYMSSEFQDQLLAAAELPAYTAYTTTDPAKLRRELDDIACAGYATSTSELTSGAREAAAPIRNHTGAVVATVSVVSPAARMDDEELARLVDPVMAAAHTISLRIGYKGARRSTAREPTEATPLP
jgi:IclR family KDG regulon transcriptional repressor